MSIRTSEKRKLPPYDSLTESQPEQTSKHSKNAKPPKDKDTRSQNEVCILSYITIIYLLQNSNTSNENESKGRHKLRNSVKTFFLLNVFISSLKAFLANTKT